MKYVFDENREIINNAMLCIIVHSKHASEAFGLSFAGGGRRPCRDVEVNNHSKLDNMTLSATVPLY